jgi:hypothetical protein
MIAEKKTMNYCVKNIAKQRRVLKKFEFILIYKSYIEYEF